MDSPEPAVKRISSGSPFSPLSRAQNPSTVSSPIDDYAVEGAELGLLAMSPPPRSRPQQRIPRVVY